MTNTTTGETLTLKGKTYTVAKRGECGMDLRGARGGEFVLIQNKFHGHWTLIDSAGRVVARFAAGTVFEVLS